MATDDKALLWAAVTDIDLQVYKASVYKLRWDFPGAGLDLGIPALYQAQETLDNLVDWPDELDEPVSELRDRLSTYIQTLEARDYTTASAQQTRLFKAVASLRKHVLEM